MQKIIPNFWFNTQADEAVEFYTSIFNNSKINFKTKYSEVGHEVHGMPAGTTLTIDFELEGMRFVALNGGPAFTLNPSISISVQCETEEEINRLNERLTEGGKSLMELGNYGFSQKYAWVEDRFGVTWQLNLPHDVATIKDKLTIFLMFCGNAAGKSEEAINFYTSVFPDSKINEIFRYGADRAPNKDGSIEHASFNLAGQEFMAFDSADDHKFNFNEAVSLIVECEDQAEIDQYWEKLSAVPESEQCGWLKDKFGVSWQIVPKGLDEMLKPDDQERADRVMKGFLEMKKIDIAELHKLAENK